MKENKIHNMYQSQKRSTDLCIDLYIHSTHGLFCGGYYFEIQLVDLVCGVGGVGDKSVPCAALVIYYFRTYHRLAAHLYSVPLGTISNTFCVSDFYAVFGTASFPQGRRHFTVQ
jgi:hypothetical protein